MGELALRAERMAAGKARARQQKAPPADAGRGFQILGAGAEFEPATFRL